MLSNLGFIIFLFLNLEYQSLHAKYETPKLKIDEKTISRGAHPSEKLITICPNTPPKAPYGPSNNPKTKNKPICGQYSPKSNTAFDERSISQTIIKINGMNIFFILSIIIPHF